MRMNRRTFGLGGLAAASVALSGAGLHHARAAGQGRQNFLFMISDDLNDWVTALGEHPQVKTPNIDALAASGTVFTNAHAQAPICGPSRASFLSGLYPTQTGIYGQITDAQLGPAVAAVSPTALLPQYLRAQGYYTAARGKISHGGATDGMFDDYVERESEFGPGPEKRFKWFDPRTHTDWGAYPDTDEQMQDHKFASWGADFLKRSHDKPFMLALGFIRPHAPWYVPQAWLDKFPLDEIALPVVTDNDLADVPQAGRDLAAVPQMPTLEWARSHDEWRPILQAYLASIAFVDHCVGMVMQALRASGRDQDTLICFTSDNGYHLGEKGRFAKMSLWERSTRVPLIFAGPQVTPSIVTDPVGLIDLYPTALDMLGLAANPENAGRSLRPLLTGQKPLPARPQLTVQGPGNYAVNDARYRYIRYADGSEELYDHRNDPMEWRNLARRSSAAPVKARLAAYIPKTARPDVMK